MRQKSRIRSSEGGFSLVELMIASAITLVIMGVAFTTFDNALTLNDMASKVADSSQNLRVGTNLLVRDLLQAGRNIQTGGIAIPSGNGAGPIYRPSPPGESLTFDNVTATTLSAITTGAGLGPTINDTPTDLISILMDDPFLPPLTLAPADAENMAVLAPDGTWFDVGPHTEWLEGNPDEGIAPIRPGDLIYFLASTGTTLQTVTSVTDSRVNFAAADPFNLNQQNAEAGSIVQILGVEMTARRVLMYMYYVHEETSGNPRLVRMLNHSAPQVMAGVIESLDLAFDLVDGVHNPTNVKNLPHTANGVTYSASQIRKVNVSVGVRSENPLRSNTHLRNQLSTVVSIRNLAYVSRYD